MNPRKWDNKIPVSWDLRPHNLRRGSHADVCGACDVVASFFYSFFSFFLYCMHFFNTQFNLKGRLKQHIVLGIICCWEYCNLWRPIRYHLHYESAIEITIWFAFSLDFVDLINFFCELNRKNFKISRTMWFPPPGTCDVGL